MVDLQDVAALSIKVKSSYIILDHNIYVRFTRKVPLKELLPGLLNKSLFYPENVYDEYLDLSHKKDIELFQKNELHYEILVLPAGLLGIEFIKTHIFYTPDDKAKTSCIVQCLHGNATIILQKNKPKEQFDLETSVKEAYLITIRRGEKVIIPSGYFYTFVNTSNSTVVIARLYKQKDILDYQNFLKREQGLAYFTIRKNARTEIVFNPRYKHIPKIKKLRPHNDLVKFQVSKAPIYLIAKKQIDTILKLLSEL